MKTVTKINLTFLIIFLLWYNTLAQNIVVDISNVSAQPGDTIAVPVQVENFNNIGAFSFKINFNNETVEFISIKSNEIDIFYNDTGGTIALGWYDISGQTPFSMNNGELFRLYFHLINDSSILSFEKEQCEITYTDGNEAEAQYIDGTINSITGIVHENIRPGIFELNQNYPNPFNPSTAVGFQLSAFSHVTLTVFDVLGREITTLINEEKPRGEYTIEFKPDDSLPTGFYIYQLNADNFIQTKKMVYLK